MIFVISDTQNTNRTKTIICDIKSVCVDYDNHSQRMTITFLTQKLDFSIDKDDATKALQQFNGKLNEGSNHYTLNISGRGLNYIN